MPPPHLPKKSATEEVPESQIPGGWGSVLGKYCLMLKPFLRFSLAPALWRGDFAVGALPRPFLNTAPNFFSRKRSLQKHFLALPLGDTRRTFYFFWISFVLSASWFGVSYRIPSLLFYFFLLNHSPSSTNSAFSLCAYIYPPVKTRHLHNSGLVPGLCLGQQLPLLQVSDFKQASGCFQPLSRAGQLTCPAEIQLHGGIAGMLTMPLRILSGSLKAFLPTQGRAGRFAPKTDVGECRHNLRQIIALG